MPVKKYEYAYSHIDFALTSDEKALVKHAADIKSSHMATIAREATLRASREIIENNKRMEEKINHEK